MAMNNQNVTAARQRVAGVFFSAPVGTTLVTTASEALGEDYAGLGMLSEDGVVMTIDSETTDLLNMDGDVALSITSKHDVKFKCTPMEFLNAAVLKEQFGADNVTVGEGGKVEAIKMKNVDMPPKPFIFDLRLRDAKVLRVVIPRGDLSVSGDYAFKRDEAVGAEWTVTGLADENGVKAYMYFAEV